MFRKIVSKFIGFCIPQFKPIIDNRISLKSIENVESNTEKSSLVKIIEPHKIVNSKIGKGTYLATNSNVLDTSIGKFCSIGPNFLCGWGLHPTDGLSTNPYFYSTRKQNGGTIAKKDLFEEKQQIQIGNDVFIGANVTVLDGVTIGDGAIIGAGALVAKNIPDYAIAYGNPIEIKRYRFTELQRNKLTQIAWWNFNDAQLLDVNKYFYDIDKFIDKYDK